MVSLWGGLFGGGGCLFFVFFEYLEQWDVSLVLKVCSL